MFSYPKILVGTDFSKCSDLALKAGEEIRRRCNGEMHVIHVSTYPSEWDLIGQMTYLPESFHKEHRKKINQQLEEQISRCEIKCTYEVISGDPFEVLNYKSEKLSSDILVLGHRGAGSKFKIFGSLSAKMVASSDIPVLIINSDFNVQKIAGLVDTNEPASDIFSVAEECSFLFSADLEYISVWQDTSAKFIQYSALELPLEHIIYTSEEKASILKSMEKTIQQRMDPRSKAKIHVEVSEKSISDALLACLNSNSIDLAVVSCHHRKAYEKIFIGSVTRRLLELFDRNIIVVPSNAGKND